MISSCSFTAASAISIPSSAALAAGCGAEPAEPAGFAAPARF